MMNDNQRWLCALLLAVSLISACSSKSASSGEASDTSSPASVGASATAAASASPTAPPYPGWASAAVPDYPNTIDQMLVRDDFYQIDTADDGATVLSWYKSHVTGSWVPAGSPDNLVLSNAHGVRIQIDKLNYGNQPVGNRPRTIICLNRIVNGQAQPC